MLRKVRFTARALKGETGFTDTASIWGAWRASHLKTH